MLEYDNWLHIGGSYFMAHFVVNVTEFKQLLS